MAVFRDVRRGTLKIGTIARIDDGPDRRIPVGEQSQVMGQKGSVGARLGAIVFAILLVSCGLGSALIIGFTSAFVAPSVRLEDEATKAGKRLAVEIGTWSEPSIRKAAEDPESAKWASAIQKGQSQFGPLMGTPALSLRGGVFVAAGEKRATLRGTAIFEKGQGEITMDIAQVREGPWKVRRWETKPAPPAQNSREPEDSSRRKE